MMIPGKETENVSMEWMRKRRKEDKDAHIGMKGQKKKKIEGRMKFWTKR